MTTDTASLLDTNKVMDVRAIPCSIKHGLIIRTWFELPVGDYFIPLNDRDPVPLYHQFAAEFGAAVQWEYLERGPHDFRIKISKVKALGAASPASACGCRGQH